MFDTPTIAEFFTQVVSVTTLQLFHASSNNMTFGSRKRARQIATRCFCPPDSRLPRGPTLVSKPWLPFLSLGLKQPILEKCTSPDWLFQKKSVEVFLVFQILKCIRLLGNDITSWTMEFPPQLPERAVCWRQEFNEQMQNLVEFVARKVGKFSGSSNHTMGFDGDETSRNFPRKRASKCIMHVRLSYILQKFSEPSF